MKKPPPVIEGLSWPVTGTDDKGETLRSTQETGKQILATALDAIDSEAAGKVRSERKWRFKYTKHFVKSVELSCATPEAALKVAAAGLDYMYDKFEFIREGKTYSVREALQKFDGTFATGFVKGNKPKPSSFTLEVPYNGQVLSGDSLQQQLDKWVRQGVIELSCGAAISQVARATPWLDLSDRYFVLLGAGAAMGPLEVILALGGNIIAVDLNAERIWERLITKTRDSCGSITFPLVAGSDQAKLSDAELFKAAGCNLFTQTPEIKNWLLKVHPDKSICVGGYAYIPGDLFPRVALAMDCIIKELSEKRLASVAFLCTPTDVHLVPPAAYAASKANLARVPLWQKFFALVSNGRWCAKNARKPVVTAAGETLYVCDALVGAQGPNYALAKRMQHWRAMLARERGCIISSNIAPSTKTVSVMQNQNFAKAYSTMHNFAPYEIPGPETSNSVMTALLIHDLNEPMHAGNKAMPLASPQQIFSQGGFHGGAWRCAHTFDSIGVPAVLLYYIFNLVVKNYLIAYNAIQTVGWSCALFGAVRYAATGMAGTPWAAFGGTLLIFQNLAVLEVVNAALGMVRSPWVTTLMQVISRVAVVNLVEYMPEMQSNPYLVLVAFCWGLTEVIRYGWYATNLVTKPPAAHTWLRYSTFLVLYPLGVFGEIMLYVAAVPLLAAIVVGGLSPASIVKYVIFPSYVPGLPILYMYMLSQRKKVLGKSSKKKDV